MSMQLGYEENLAIAKPLVKARALVALAYYQKVRF